MLHWIITQTHIYFTLTFKWLFFSPGIPGNWLRLHGKHQTESCSNTNIGFKACSAFDRIWICTQRITWENKDKKGTDPSNDTDDFTDVWHKDGDEQRHRDPEHCQHVAAAAFKLRCHHAVTSPPPTQQGVLDHWSDVQMIGALCLINQHRQSQSSDT